MILIDTGAFYALIDKNDSNHNKYHEAGFGFVDSTCFVLCEKYKINKVFTYDRKHFKIYKPSFSDSLQLLP